MQCRDLKLSDEFDFKTLASQTPGFVGADLTALVREAAMCAVTRYNYLFNLSIFILKTRLLSVWFDNVYLYPLLYFSEFLKILKRMQI